MTDLRCLIGLHDWEGEEEVGQRKMTETGVQQEVVVKKIRVKHIMDLDGGDFCLCGYVPQRVGYLLPGTLCEQCEAIYEQRTGLLYPKKRA